MEVPRRGGVEWFGDARNDGTFFAAFGETRPAELYLQLALAFAHKNGYERTPTLLRMLWQNALEREAEFYAQIRARGISKGLRDLLGATRKKDVERIADEIVIEAGEFSDLCVNCHMLGVSRHAKFQHFEPQQRLLTAEERARLIASEGKALSPEDAKVVAKLRQLMVEREHRSIHMFANSDAWHCFFFTFDDTADGDNHWRGGAHVHFVDHVFDPRLKQKTVWKALDERRHSVPKVHIRFHHPQQSRHDGSLVYLDGSTGTAVRVLPKPKT